MEDSADRAPQSMGRATSVLLAFALALAVFAVDQALKSLVEGSMRLGESITIIPGFLSLTYIHNDGGAFGLLGGNQSILMAGSVIAVAVVLWTLLSGPASALTTAGCGLILGGAAGNMFDRVTSGHVTDYVHFSFWYIFNAADTAIVAGAALLLMGMLRRPEKD